MEFNEAVLYSDDGLCIRYADGSVLQLSSCSSAFRYHKLSSPCIQQLSRFAVSSFGKQVISAISLRNQFARHPYLCKELLNKDCLIVIHKEIKECTWPRTVLPEFVVANSDGSIVVKSLDGYASLTLNSHKKTFTVCYLAEVNPESTQPKINQQSKKKQNSYAWVWKGETSVDDCQESWFYPLEMALSIGNGVQTTKELSKINNVSKLPCSLPVTCSASHMHKWMLKEFFSGKENEEVFWHPNLKVIWKNKVAFRVYRNKNEMLKIEIHPGDGSVIYSSSFTGKFFTHCTGNTEDKMYPVDKPPPDKPGIKYSIAKLIRQGARLFDFILQVGLHNTSETTLQCWQSKVKEQENVLPQTIPLQITETANIPNVGRFVAYSNGHLHIAFADRTILNVRYPKRVHEPFHQNEILKSGLIFNMVLSNGHTLQVYGHNMHGLERYIRLACEWGDWINSSPQQRQSFYRDTFYDQEQTRVVEAEIGKLRRFNYILNNGSLNQVLVKKDQKHSATTLKIQKDVDQQGKKELSAPTIHIGLSSINDALKKTSDAIKDIDTFLNSKTVKR